MDESSPVSVPSSLDHQVAEREIANGLRQYDVAIEIIKTFLDPEYPFSLRPHLLLELQALAVDGIEPSPGQWRTGEVRISKSKHAPPPPFLVPFKVQEMCDYVNDNFHEKTPFHLAAYVMWRLNWIHPFSDGNGRTSRVLSYMVLSVALKALLPGSPTIPQLIQRDRTPYFKALETADAADLEGRIDLTEMEVLIKHLLAAQLLSVIDQGSGETHRAGS